MTETIEEKPEENATAEPVEVAEQPAPAQPAGEAMTPPPVTGGQPPSGSKVKLAVVVFLMLAVGAVILGIISGRRARFERVSPPETAQTPTPAAEEDTLTAQYEQVSDSDEISAIEADLNATSFEGIDAELATIDAELSAEE